MRFRFISPLLLSVAVLLVYGSTLGHSFHTIDDSIYIYKNAAVLEFSLRTIGHIFTHFDPELYVPLTVFTYQIEHLLYGLNPLGYHITNLVLHILTSSMVFAVLRKLSIRWSVALFAALLFALHPLNTEAVSWISGRKDLLSTLFTLGSLFAYITWDHSRKRWLTLSIVLFLLALLSKVSAAPLPVILLLYEVYRGRSLQLTRTWKPLVPFFGLALLFGVIALAGKEGNIQSLSLLSTALLLLRSIVFVTGQFFVPRLSFIYPFREMIAPFDTDILLSGLLVLAFALIIVTQRKRAPRLFLGLSIYLILLLPIVGSFVRGEGVYLPTDRYAYLPMVGLLIAIASAVEYGLQRFGRPKMFALLGAVLIVLCSVLSFDRSRVWKDDESLYLDTLARSGEVRDIRYNLALHYDETARYPEAVESYEKVLEMDPQFAKALNAYGYLTLRIGDLDEAIDLLERAVRADPTRYRSYVNLGRAYGKAERYEEGIAAFMKAIELDPKGEELDVKALINELKIEN